MTKLFFAAKIITNKNNANSVKAITFIYASIELRNKLVMGKQIINSNISERMTMRNTVKFKIIVVMAMVLPIASALCMERTDGAARTPLMEAAFHSHVAIDLLIQHGAAVPERKNLRTEKKLLEAPIVEKEQEVRLADIKKPTIAWMQFLNGWRHVLNLNKMNLSDIRGIPDVYFRWAFWPRSASVKDTKDLVLNLSANRLTTLPQELFLLTNLKELHLWVNRIEVLPEAIEKCTALEVLDLSANRLKELPLLKLPALKKLLLFQNRLEEFFSEHSLNALTELDLGKNQLAELPELSLPVLIRLDLSHNKLTAIPFLGSLPLLEELDMGHNALTQLANLSTQERAPYVHLKSLDLSYNNLTWIPAQLDHCSNLQYLYINNNSLTELPRLPHLEILLVFHAQHNQFTEQPIMGLWEWLADIDLSHNALTAIHGEIHTLHDLKRLNLSHNKLNYLPAFQGRWIDLNVDNNRLTSVDLGHPWALESLALLLVGRSKYKAKEVRPGVEFDSLDVPHTDVRVLDLSFNQLERLSDSFEAVKDDLHTLYLDDNKLITLPKELAQLKHLTCLSIMHNDFGAMTNPSLSRIVRKLLAHCSATVEEKKELALWLIGLFKKDKLWIGNPLDEQPWVELPSDLKAQIWSLIGRRHIVNEKA